MKIKAFISIAIGAIFAWASPAAYACTGLRLIAEDDGVVIGRTLEFGFDVESDVLVVPAGTTITSSLPNPEQGIQYTSQYGMVGANAIGRSIIVDGINDAGLYVGSFYFPGYAEYAETDPALAEQTLAPEDYGTWLLANFATVEEVKANFDQVVLVDNSIPEIGGQSAPLHFVVHDASGASIVIEPIEGTLRLHENPLGVVTNSPTFDWHMTNLRNYINLTATNVPPVEAETIQLTQFGEGTGMLGLPGDFTPPSRFIRAVAFSQFAQQLPTAEETVNQVFHVMNAFDIPVGAVRNPHGDEIHYDYTVWTSVTDLANQRYAFRTYNDQTIRSIDIDAALAAAGDEVKVIEMDSEQPIQDVSTDFK